MKQSFRAMFSHNEDPALAILVALAVLKLVIHLLTSSNYGYFRDDHDPNVRAWLSREEKPRAR